MKRIYASLALLLIAATGAFAQQRHCDVSVTLVGPAPGNYACSSGVLSGYVMINNGPDTVKASDTLIITDPNLDNTTVPAGQVAIYYAYPSGPVAIGGPTDSTVFYDIKPGDTILNYQWIDSASRLSSLINADTPIIYDPSLGDSVYNWVYTPYGTAPANGNYIWLAQCLGFQDSLSVTDTGISNNLAAAAIVINCTTAINDTKFSNVALTVYPNPTSDNIYFNYTLTKAAVVTSRIMDLTGRTLKTVNLGKAAPGTQKFEINVNDLPAGTYLLEFTADDKKGISKFTKQ